MTQEAWLNCLDSLKGQHKKVAEIIGSLSVAYIDIPTHFNIGDLLIYKGTEAFFEEYNINVLYRSGCAGISFKKIQQVDVILFHGGGNFGDLYPMHQKLREKVVNQFKHKKIICLPQSIYFDCKTEQEKSVAIFKQHPNFHLLVRDQYSFDKATDFTDKVMTIPDMAYSLHPLVDMSEVGPVNIVPKRILNLRRCDKEQVKPLSKEAHVNKKSFDWQDLITAPDYWRWCLFYKLIKVPAFRAWALNSWRQHCDELIFKSINHFIPYHCVYTDRLHGMILATLLGKEIHFDDNSYGKNSAFYEYWLCDYPFINKP